MSDDWGSLVEDLSEATLDALWQQWAALGAGAATRPASSIVDPEALILMSLALRDREHRLADTIESWVAVNSTLLSIQRVKNLQGAFPGAVTDLLPAVAAVGIRHKDLRWKSLRTPDPPELGARGNKLRAGRVRFGGSGSLMLQLRRGMGVGVKADIVAYLLGVPDQGRTWANISAIAGATGYTRAAVRRSTEELADARFIKSLDTVDSSAAQRMFSADLTQWRHLLQLNGDVRWRAWLPRYAFISHFFAAWPRLSRPETSEYARSVIARELIDRHRPALRQDQIVHDEALANLDDSESLLRHSLRSVKEWMQKSV